MLDPALLRRVLRLRQLTRTVQQYGQIRLHNFGLYVEQGLWGHVVDVLVYDDVVRIEQAAQLVVSYPSVYDARQRRLTEIDPTGRQQYVEMPVPQLVLFVLVRRWVVWPLPRYRRKRASPHTLPELQSNLWPDFTD